MITSLESDVIRYPKMNDTKYYVGPWITIKKNKGISRFTKTMREAKFRKQVAKEQSLSVMERYNMENNRYLIDLIRRYRRNHVILHEADGEPFPIYSENNINITQTCKGCDKHYLITANFVNNNICKNCYNLPLPSYPLINSMPCIVEKCYVSAEKLVKRPVITKLKNVEDVNLMSDLKYFDQEFINFVKDQRLKLSLTQDQFARRINYNSGIIRDLEAGKLLFDSKLKSVITEYFN
jgi:hypothetical protein